MLDVRCTIEGFARVARENVRRRQVSLAKSISFCPVGVKTDDGVSQFGQKRSFCPAGVRSREATPKQQSWGDSEATVVRRLRSNQADGAAVSQLAEFGALRPNLATFAVLLTYFLHP